MHSFSALATAFFDCLLIASHISLLANINVLIPSPLLFSSVLKVFNKKTLMHITVISYNTVLLVLGGIQLWSSARDSESA